MCVRAYALQIAFWCHSLFHSLCCTHGVHCVSYFQTLYLLLPLPLLSSFSTWIFFHSHFLSLFFSILSLIFALAFSHTIRGVFFSISKMSKTSLKPQHAIFHSKLSIIVIVMRSTQNGNRSEKFPTKYCSLTISCITFSANSMAGKTFYRDLVFSYKSYVLCSQFIEIFIMMTALYRINEQLKSSQFHSLKGMVFFSFLFTGITGNISFSGLVKSEHLQYFH